MSTARARSRRVTRGPRRLGWLAWGLASVACGEPFGAPPNFGSSDSGDGSSTSGGPATEGTADSSGTEATPPGWSTSLEVGTDVGAFLSVWGPTPEGVYAVASQPLEGGLSQGAMWRWDGAQWSAQALPAETPGLNWVFGIEDRRFAVGELGVILVRDGDEGDFTRLGCGTILPLWGVWAASPDDAWAVGGDGFNRDPVACHYDGTTWTLVTLPEPSFESHALYKVWGTAADDVWAVGDEGLVMHYTGEAAGWVEVPSGADVDLISLWGTGPDEILAVGGRTGGMLARFDGVQWQATPAPELPGLNGIWMDAQGRATVVGPQGVVGTVAPGATEVELDDGGTALALHGVFGFDEGPRWAVGGSLDQPPPQVGIVLVHP